MMMMLMTTMIMMMVTHGLAEVLWMRPVHEPTQVIQIQVVIFPVDIRHRGMKLREAEGCGSRLLDEC
eukprot:7469311-Karenia_brevis.AAC.1